VPGEPNAGIPMVDTWWQSETGATILSPRPGDTVLKPGCGTRALPGVATDIVDEDGARVPANVQGNIVLTATGPAMARTVWGDPERYFSSYWQKYAAQGWFLAGDGAKYDDDGDIWILGRTDDAVNISGHLLSTIEIESALVSHPGVVEAGVCPTVDATTGHAATAFVVPRDKALLGGGTSSGSTPSQLAAAADLRAHVATQIGPIAKPRDIVFVPDVPKTRSGKIMRRLLTQLFEGSALGDTTSLQNEECLPALERICAAG
ncbi:MAG: AMP-binding protein, partial [Micrococcaceae bacterium]|nr:AMP-binding protein [Micrococcaceae bacterium]